MSHGSMQRVMILGRIGTDPDVKTFQNDQMMVNLNIATSERIKSKKTDEFEEVTTWHHVSVFGQAAKYCQDYLKAGDSVFVEAKLRPKTWEDKEGKTHKTLDIIATSVQGVGRRANSTTEKPTENTQHPSEKHKSTQNEAKNDLADIV